MMSTLKKSCIIQVQAGEYTGVIGMSKGVLLTAQAWKSNSLRGGSSFDEKKYGEDAVLQMLLWEDPKIKFTPLTKKITPTITRSLEFLLIESEKLKNAQQKVGIEDSRTEVSTEQPVDKKEDFVKRIEDNSDVCGCLILDEKGNVVFKKDDSISLNADLLSYIQYSFQFAGNSAFSQDRFSTMHFDMENGDSVLVYCSSTNVIGLSINPKKEIDHVRRDLLPFITAFQAAEFPSDDIATGNNV